MIDVFLSRGSVSGPELQGRLHGGQLGVRGILLRAVARRRILLRIRILAITHPQHPVQWPDSSNIGQTDSLFVVSMFPQWIISALLDDVWRTVYRD